MSEGEVTALRKDIQNLSSKTDRQHEDNQREIKADRTAFEAALRRQQEVFERSITTQRDDFQKALNKQFVEHLALEKKVDRVHLLLDMAIGSGQPGEGRVGQLESAVETLKKFRWQALAIIAMILLLADKLGPWIGKH